ncbi:hypothetical protein TcasGA2_TC012902 [Tribolium castaneum]|uniref:SprT-like domain-containing protein n=3 Tax=Tribolium castaneum TaxID=7070 RepID=D7ELF4_TRICA|nr:hypothetical protein TcasGA2_TC012902 [Tribolium castaneum]
MNGSFELLSTMSPKVNKSIINSNLVPPCKKQTSLQARPTKLALRKYFRKSQNARHVKQSIKHDLIIEIESSSSCSFEEKVLNETPIVISDSDNSFIIEKTPVKTVPEKDCNKRHMPGQSNERMSKGKYNSIELWVEDVNKAKHNVSGFSEISSMIGNDNPGFKKSNINDAASSTMLESNLRFDELFRKKNINQENDLTVNNSLKSENQSLENVFKNMILNDSLYLNESFTSRLKNKNCVADNNKNSQRNGKNDTQIGSSQLDTNKSHNTSPGREKAENMGASDCEEYEKLLDSLYGNSWRDKREDILPSSEPKLKKNKLKITKAVPNTERRENKFSNLLDERKESNLLKDLQRARFRQALESPLMETIKKLCDSDTDSEDENKMPHVKLNFDDESSESDCVVPTKSPIKKTQLLKENNENFLGTCSFLASLSGCVPATNCDMTALIFRNNFKQQRDKLTEKLFHLYNEQVFDNSISEDTRIEWSEKLRGTAGYCRCRKITKRTGVVERHATIVLSSKVLDRADRLRDTLIHEMCHAATWIVNQVTDGHGPFWKSWASRAMKTFPELPPIKRCHEYVINTKYTYKCTGCGYSIGRHTKSLNTETKRCGYCYGKFEVLINKISKKGETKSIPATPKKPSGFALFVKENYATVKTPDLKHGDVMKILGQQFADLKVDQS